MGRLESALQELHEGRKLLEITWFWDNGVDVKAGDKIRNFRSVSEILPWLQHWYSLTPKAQRADALEAELQKIYDSEINVTLRIDGDRIFVALGNDFTGFDAEWNLTSAARRPSLDSEGNPQALSDVKIRRGAARRNLHLRDGGDPTMNGEPARGQDC